MFEVNNQLFFSEHARNNCPRVASLHTILSQYCDKLLKAAPQPLKSQNTDIFTYVTSDFNSWVYYMSNRNLCFSQITSKQWRLFTFYIKIFLNFYVNVYCLRKKAAYIFLHFCPLYPHLTNRPKHFIGNAIIIPCSPEYSSSNILSNASISINYVPGSNIFWYTACNKMSSP